MKKRYRIRSHTRFTIFLTLVILSTIYFAGLAFGGSQAVSLTEPAYATIIVQNGDTLWGLAKAYGPEHQDIRRTVYTICQINSITPDDIKPGDMIWIPQQ